jgi:hypothetical protein
MSQIRGQVDDKLVSDVLGHASGHLVPVVDIKDAPRRTAKSSGPVMMATRRWPSG